MNGLTKDRRNKKVAESLRDLLPGCPIAERSDDSLFTHGSNGPEMIQVRPASHFSTRASSGFTLIELLLVLSLVSSLLGGTIGLIAIVRGSDQQAKRNLLIRQELRRFADDVRRDVESADVVDIVEHELVLSQDSQGTRIVYRVVSGTTVSRAVEGSGDLGTTRDHYRVGKGANIRVDWLNESSAGQEIYPVQWTFTESERPAKPIHVIAVPKEPT